MMGDEPQMTPLQQKAMAAMIEAHELACQLRGHREASRALYELAQWIQTEARSEAALMFEIGRRAGEQTKKGHDLVAKIKKEIVNDASNRN